MSKMIRTIAIACVAAGAISSIAIWMHSTIAEAESNERVAPPPEDVTALVAELRKEVEDLRDRQRIHEVYVRFGRGIDRLDEESFRKAFWPDAQINSGTDSITVDDQWNNHVIKGYKGHLTAWGHLLTNQAVDIDGDAAHVETYLVSLTVPKQKGRLEQIIAGRYIDRLDRRNGEWRIAVREFIPHFSMKTDTNFEFFDPWFKDAKSDCKWGPTGRRDVAYVRPLTARMNKQAGPPCAAGS